MGSVLVACEWGPPREDVPGSYLGRYVVDATLDRTTCGGGNYQAPEDWSFEVRLSREDAHFYWTTSSDIIAGQADEDGSFQLESTLEVELTPARAPWPGCVVDRRDTIAGTLDGQGTDVTAFAGTLTFEYSTSSEYDCTQETIDGTAPPLPCHMDYSMTAERAAAE